MTTINSDIAGTANIKHRRNNTFSKPFTFTQTIDEVTTAIDLTGYSAELTIALNNGETPLITASTSNSMLTIGGAEDNEIAVLIPATSFNLAARIYEWQLTLTSSGGIVTTYAQGKFNLTEGPP
jgi:hypothetical protein